tara:strand:+ start:1892 stop:2050 length:159 start_codon:yes stop_codon:yes gene_type:complete
MSEFSADDLVWIYGEVLRLLVEREKLSPTDAWGVLAEVKKELADEYAKVVSE